MDNLHSILSDPAWFPYVFDSRFQNLTFIKTAAEPLRRAPFLDERFLTADTQTTSLPIAELIQPAAALAHAVKPAFIFHSAFCCSTLMAGALDNPKKVLALKEPQILMSLANAKRMLARNNRPRAEYERLMVLVINLLSRRFSTEEAIVIKPTNAVNNIIEDVRKMGLPFIMLQSNLEDFLISVLKKGEPCKSFIRTQYNIFSLDHGPISKIDPRQAMTLTDLQVACLVWRHQILLFKTLGARSLLINDKAFLAQQEQTVLQAAQTLGLDMSAKDASALTAQRYFSKNAKFQDQALSARDKEQSANAIRQKYSQEISESLAWNARLQFG